jgi:hypothetical protein
MPLWSSSRITEIRLAPFKISAKGKNLQLLSLSTRGRLLPGLLGVPLFLLPACLLLGRPALVALWVGQISLIMLLSLSTRGRLLPGLLGVPLVRARLQRALKHIGAVIRCCPGPIGRTR